MSTITQQIYERLLQRLGPQSWWPGESPFEVMVGAVLVQNTAWKNVERAIDNLRDAGLLDPQRLYAVQPQELEELIRPAGYFRVKARRLRSLLEYFVTQYDGSIDAMRSVGLTTLREELLGLHGIGPETADSILLYALELPAVVVDSYTHRIYARHGWVDYATDYHQLQEHVASELPIDVPLYNELHALLVHVGHHYCKRTRPKCESCPLREMLPAEGFVEME